MSEKVISSLAYKTGEFLGKCYCNAILEKSIRNRSQITTSKLNMISVRVRVNGKEYIPCTTDYTSVPKRVEIKDKEVDTKISTPTEDPLKEYEELITKYIKLGYTRKFMMEVVNEIINENKLDLNYGY